MFCIVSVSVAFTSLVDFVVYISGIWLRINTLQTKVSISACQYGGLCATPICCVI